MRLLAIAAGAAVLLAACATHAPGDVEAAARPAVLVTRDGEAWSADFTFDRDSPAWGFRRSALRRSDRRPWRLAQWTVETPGVVLERQGEIDILRAVNGGTVPRRVRVAMRPAADNLEADYPNLVFTDGSVALFTDHFDVFPLSSADAALNATDGGSEVEGEASRVTWRDRAGPVLFRGKRRKAPTEIAAASYVLFGGIPLIETPRLATVMDPRLPAWIGAEINDFAPKVVDYYAARLGTGPRDRPTIMMSWNGPAKGRRSMGGSVLDGLIVMAFEGEGVVQSSPELRDQARWFIGHEGAHFWLGQVVRYETRKDAWITEGGADLMAIRALQALDPAYGARQELQKEVDDCVTLADEPVSTAHERGELRAYYACGAVFAMVAEGLQKQRTGGDWFDVLRPLIDANRADEVLTREEWLASLSALAGDTGVRGNVEQLLDRGASDPAAVIERLLKRGGVPVQRSNGKLTLT